MPGKIQVSSFANFEFFPLLPDSLQNKIINYISIKNLPNGWENNVQPDSILKKRLSLYWVKKTIPFFKCKVTQVNAYLEVAKVEVSQRKALQTLKKAENVINKISLNVMNNCAFVLADRIEVIFKVVKAKLKIDPASAPEMLNNIKRRVRGLPSIRLEVLMEVLKMEASMRSENIQETLQEAKAAIEQIYTPSDQPHLFLELVKLDIGRDSILQTLEEIKEKIRIFDIADQAGFLFCVLEVESKIESPKFDDTLAFVKAVTYSSLESHLSLLLEIEVDRYLEVKKKFSNVIFSDLIFRLERGIEETTQRAVAYSRNCSEADQEILFSKLVRCQLKMNPVEILNIMRLIPNASTQCMIFLEILDSGAELDLKKVLNEFNHAILKLSIHPRTVFLPMIVRRWLKIGHTHEALKAADFIQDPKDQCDVFLWLLDAKAISLDGYIEKFNSSVPKVPDKADRANCFFAAAQALMKMGDQKNAQVMLIQAKGLANQLGGSQKQANLLFEIFKAEYYIDREIFLKTLWDQRIAFSKSPILEEEATIFLKRMEFALEVCPEEYLEILTRADKWGFLFNWFPQIIHVLLEIVKATAKFNVQDALVLLKKIKNDHCFTVNELIELVSLEAEIVPTEIPEMLEKAKSKLLKKNNLQSITELVDVIVKIEMKIDAERAQKTAEAAKEVVAKWKWKRTEPVDLINKIQAYRKISEVEKPEIAQKTLEKAREFACKIDAINYREDHDNFLFFVIDEFKSRMGLKIAQ